MAWSLTMIRLASFWTSGSLAPGQGGQFHGKSPHLFRLLFQGLGPGKNAFRPAPGALTEIRLSGGRSAVFAQIDKMHVFVGMPAFQTGDIHRRSFAACAAHP
jgi:hypothetical protein